MAAQPWPAERRPWWRSGALLVSGVWRTQDVSRWYECCGRLLYCQLIWADNDLNKRDFCHQCDDSSENYQPTSAWSVVLIVLMHKHRRRWIHWHLHWGWVPLSLFRQRSRSVCLFTERPAGWSNHLQRPRAKSCRALLRVDLSWRKKTSTFFLLLLKIQKFVSCGFLKRRLVRSRVQTNNNSLFTFSDVFTNRESDTESTCKDV